MIRSLEIPIEDVGVARLVAPHVDRLEVCDDLETDGWSPSSEMLAEIVQAVSSFSVDVVSLIRPRCCPDFLVSERGVSQARRDIEVASRCGADGVVLGFLARHGRIDPQSMGELAEFARSMDLSTSLHRVFDFDDDHERTIGLASECGFERILTSGAPGWSFDSHTLESRITRIREFVDSSVRHGARLGRQPLRIVACGGLRADNATDFLRATSHLHASCRNDGLFDESAFGALLEV